MGQKPTYVNDPTTVIRVRESVKSKIAELHPEIKTIAKKVEAIVNSYDSKKDEPTICMDESDKCNECEDKENCDFNEHKD